jgi:hypothetical protein
MWRRVSRELRPFYGEVRTLRDFLRVGTGVSTDDRTESNPTPSWWWKGIPPHVGHAFVLGPPYVDAWPELADASDADGVLRFVDTPDWQKDHEASAIVGGVPVRLASLEGSTAAHLAWPHPVYPPVFPFARNPP